MKFFEIYLFVFLLYKFVISLCNKCIESFEEVIEEGNNAGSYRLASVEYRCKQIYEQRNTTTVKCQHFKVQPCESEESLERGWS